MNLQYGQSNSSRRSIAVRRCEWVGDNSNLLDIKYHDEEGGISVHDDRTLLELLILECA
jgi:DNA-3-methyladenine glycosylase I